MRLSERQAQIAERVREEGFLSVEALADLFDVTAQTIRRDLSGLCDRGIVRRRHGGVERLTDNGNLAYNTRQVLELEAKQAIARAVATHVPDGASLAFSIGTTPEIVAQHLLDHTGLKVFTNNLNVAVAATTNPTFEITIAGGRLRNGDRDVLGAGTESFFSAYKVDIGIFGVAGVDEDGALLDFHTEEVAARQAIRENCRATYLVLDYSKFGRAAYVRGGRIADMDKVFCDRPPPEPIRALLARSGTEWIVCGAEAAS